MNNDGFPNHQFGNLLKRLPREKSKQKKRSGSGGGDEPPRHQAPRLLPPPSAPMQVARVFVAEMIADEDGALILRYWRGGFWRWRRSHWKQAEARLTRRLLYAFTEHALYESGVGPLPWNPNRKKIDDLIDALIALVLLPSEVELRIRAGRPGERHDRLVCERLARCRAARSSSRTHRTTSISSACRSTTSQKRACHGNGRTF